MKNPRRDNFPRQPADPTSRNFPDRITPDVVTKESKAKMFALWVIFLERPERSRGDYTRVKTCLLVDDPRERVVKKAAAACGGLVGCPSSNAAAALLHTFTEATD